MGWRIRAGATCAVSLVLGALACSTAAATDPAATFDAPGQLHAIACAHLASSPEPLRFADGSADGFSLTDQLSFYNGDCSTGTVRLDLHEVVPSAAGTLAFHRGGNGYNDAENVKYGELAAGDLADPLPAPVPSGGGRGAPCTLADEPAYAVDVRSIPSEMHYKRPQDVPSGSNSGASLMHYGDPGADQGDRHDIHYSYLLWSFVDVRGGGHVRTLLAPGQVVRPCDVETIVMDSWDSTGAVNGQVTARYVRVLAGTCRLYGWMVWSHSYSGGGAGSVSHQHALGGAPPADPVEGPGCPNAPPAAPPSVTTGDASPGWTLSGTINPNGIPTTYWFDYGPDASYGAQSQAGSLPPGTAPVAVSTPVGGLQTATTYHYRLVGSSAQGVSYGSDRSFTTAPAPPPPPTASALPPVATSSAFVPIALSRLRVTPSAFRRAGSPRGLRTRIRYVLSAPGTLALTFSRATAGIRSAGRCRRAPRRAAVRGRVRCTVWAVVPYKLSKRGSAGANSFGFGGWVGRRALLRGRYRLKVVPLDAAGRAGAARTASFTLR